MLLELKGKSVVLLALTVTTALMLALAGDAYSKTRNGRLAWTTDHGLTEMSGPCDADCLDGAEPRIPITVATVGPDGRQHRRLRCSHSPRAECDDQSPAFSPDGELLATKNPGGLVIREPSGHVVARVALAVDGYAWSPRGKFLAIAGRPVSSAGMDAAGVYRVRRDGKGMRLVVKLAGAFSVAWSPAGHDLLIGTQAAGQFPYPGAIHVVRSDGTGRRQLAVGQGVVNPTWPRRELVSWTRRRVGRSENSGDIFTANPAGTRVRRLAAGIHPVWSPHGRQAAYNCAGNLCSIASDGTHKRLLSRRCDTGRSGYAWSADGRQIACGTVQSNLVAVNFRTVRVRKLVTAAHALDITWQARR